MKKKISLWMLTAVLFTGGIMALSSCSHDKDDYVKKPYDMTDEERIRYAEQILGVKIDRNQNWKLTEQYNLKVTADADLEDIVEVAILDGSPYAGTTHKLAYAEVKNNESVTLSFRAPSAAELLYVACLTKGGLCIARPFQPGTDMEMSFRDKLTSGSEARAYAPRHAPNRRSMTGPLEPDTEKDYIIDYPSFYRAVEKLLPEGQDNRSVIGSHDYTNTLQVRENPYQIYDLPIFFIGGDNQTDIHLLYTWYPQGEPSYQESFLINDSYDGTGTVAEKIDFKNWRVNGHYLQCRRLTEDREIDRQFSPGDKLVLQLAKGKQPMDNADKRVKVFMLNGYVFIACEDGVGEDCDWDYNDRIFWMSYGAERIEKATTVPFPPEPMKPQVWTYAWEDNTMEGNDLCDYDMNDCVIEVNEKADDPTMLEITIVALGATRDLWLGFENKNGKSISDYQPVFAEGDYSQDANELHKLMNASSGEMVNTGNGTRTVEPFKATVKKPAGFDFQTCSFVLGAKVRKEMQGAYEHDFYMLHVSAAGTDPHGIIIPGQWQWPTERTCIKKAYPDFNTWASDHTKAKDWYNNPKAGEVVKR